MTRLQKTISVLIISVMMVFLLSVSTKPESNYQLADNEFIHSASSMQEAELIADEYQLELKNYSTYGFATFYNQDNEADFLIANGFSYNSYSLVDGPPWKTTTTEDPYLEDQYGLEITNTIDSWGITEGSSNITIAIIDTGIDTSHPEFVGRISALSKNIVTGQVGVSAVKDDYGHGTMVAGIIGALKDNSTGIAGITQNTSLLIIKANLEEQGAFLDNDVIEAIYYAVEQGADIINLSLGTTYQNSLTQEAVEFATDHGVIVVAASGNDGDDTLHYPASFEAVISVGAVDRNMNIADYSNHNEQVDISAPGSDVLTTTMTGGYMMASGTSFAAPHVTGILALYMSYDTDYTVDEVKTKLYASAHDLGDEGLDSYYGFGLVDSISLLTSTYHTITYVTNPGSPIDPDYVISGSYLQSTEIPILLNQIFTGWYLDSNLTIPFDSTLPITADLILYAKYTDTFHTVHFITEGSKVPDQIIEHGETFFLPTTTLAGYRFGGWYLDPEFETAYTPSPLLSDLNLYAKFEEIIYYEVNYYVQSLLYETITLESGSSIPMPEVSMEGYTFSGWYIDGTFTTVFDGSNISTNIDLYAKFDINVYSVTLNVNGEISSLQVEYLAIPVLPTVTLDGSDFAGWYLDPEFSNRYYSQPTTNDFTLYAKFISQAYTIDLIIFGEHYDYLYLEQGMDLVIPNIDFTGYDFNGWYLDEEFHTEYTDSTVTEDMTLYGEYTKSQFIIRFFDGSNQVISSQTLEWGDEIVYPENPTKPSSPAFTYSFTQWSSEAVNAYESIDIYPLFTRSFIKSSVTLNPSIDTILIGTMYEDPYISLLDSSLTIEVDSNLDTSKADRYKITYFIYDGDELVYQLKRFVRVIEPEVQVTIALNPGISTLKVGDIYIESGATASVGDVIVVGSVNTSQPGVYYIVYEVEYQGNFFSKTRIVTVEDESTMFTSTLVYVAQKEDYDE